MLTSQKNTNYYLKRGQTHAPARHILPIPALPHWRSVETSASNLASLDVEQ